MTVAVRQTPVEELQVTRVGSSRPARRAILRWAWRMFRREWRQQFLVLALLILAVAATTMGTAVASNTVSGVDATMGIANYRLTIPGSDPNLTADIATTGKYFGTIEAISHQKIVIAGSAIAADLRDQNPKGAFGYPTLRVSAGRYPTRPDEVAVTDVVATSFELSIGDVWSEGGRQLHVVGLVENPHNLLDEFALVAPGQISAPDQVSVLTTTTDARFRAFRIAGVPLNIEARWDAGKTAAAVGVLALSTIGLLFVGLVAVAGFTVMAQRRLRALGMLGAIGATDRHVRLVMLANGAVVGGVAALIGTAAGFIGWIAVVPHLETTTGHRIDRLALPWWAIGVGMALAVVTSVGAAWWPARAAARMPIVAALSGRLPRPRPTHRFAVLGSVILVAGVVVLAFGDQKKPSPAFIVGGIVLSAVGVLVMAPLGIAGLARFAGRLPISVRLALRDLARYQARSGAALAAITLAVGIAATIAISASAALAAVGPTTGNVGTNQLIVRLTDARGSGGPLPEQAPEQLQAARAHVDQLAASLGAVQVPLEMGVNPTSPDTATGGRVGGGEAPASMVRRTAVDRGFQEELVAVLYVATPELLAHFDIKATAVGRTTDVISSRTDLAGLEVGLAARETLKHPKIQIMELPKYTSAPNTLITAQTAQRLGLQLRPAGWLLEARAPLTTAQINGARHAAASAGLTVETRSAQTSLKQLRDWSIAVGLLVALGVLAMTVGLIRTETANDLRTLTATGASSTIRRNLTTATAGALALLGALTGTAGAYVALIAWYRRDLDYLGHVPMGALTVIIVGLPIAACASAWLLAGSEPRTISRQPLE